MWSAPGWVQLHRDGIDCDTFNRFHPEQQPRVPWVTEALRDAGGPVVAVTDYQKAVRRYDIDPDAVTELP